MNCMLFHAHFWHGCNYHSILWLSLHYNADPFGICKMSHHKKFLFSYTIHLHTKLVWIKPHFLFSYWINAEKQKIWSSPCIAQHVENWIPTNSIIGFFSKNWLMSSSRSNSCSSSNNLTRTCSPVIMLSFFPIEVCHNMRVPPGQVCAAYLL